MLQLNYDVATLEFDFVTLLFNVVTLIFFVLLTLIDVATLSFRCRDIVFLLCVLMSMS